MSQVLTLLAWAAWPVTLLAIIDDWFVRPRRRLAKGDAAAATDTPLMRAVHVLLPIVLIAAVLRLLGSERLDFSLVLVLVVAFAGGIWLLDHFVFAPARARAARAAGADASAQPLPVTVDYARSFFPVALIVLLVRSFIFEPFRIPSDSMLSLIHI